MNTPAINLFAPSMEIIKEIDFPQWDEDHPRAIRGMKWSRSGHALAVYSLEDPGFYVWDQRQASPTFRFGRLTGFSSLAWSSDDRYVATGYIDGAVLVHDAETGKVVWQANGDGEFGEWIVVDWLPGQNRIISMGSSRNVMCLWTIGSDTPEAILERGLSNPERMAVSPDGAQVAFISNRISVRNLGSNQTHRLEPWMNDICLDWAPDSRLLAVGSRWAWPGIRVWDAARAELVATLQGAHGLVPAVSFSAHGRFLAAASDDSILRLWRTNDWELVAQIPELTGGIGSGLAFHPQEQLLAAGANGGRKIRLWKYDSNRLLAS